MATKRTPIGIAVNGAFLRVRDPNAAAANDGTLFASYQTMPGAASFTLPAETGSVNETALMDGTVSAAAYKGVGTITGVIGALGAHPVHQFMEARANDQAQVQIEITRPATAVGRITLSPATFVTVATSARRFNFANDAVKSNIRRLVAPGHLVAFQADDSIANTLPGDSQDVSPYDRSTPVAADNTNWQVVLEVDEDGDWIDVAPGYQADRMVAASKTGALHIRLPGRRYSDIVGVVNQWDAGDFQNGAIVAGNMTFTPVAQLPNVTVEQRTSV